MKKARRPIKGILFFIGWLLSPFSFWNDAIVNIPLSYVLANIAVKFLGCDFSMAMLVSYWITNIAGIAIILLSGKQLIKGKEDLIRETRIILLTIIAYSAIVFILSRSNIIKPLHF